MCTQIKSFKNAQDKRDLTDEYFLQHVQLEPSHPLWEHLRPLRAWCATQERIRACLRQDALIVQQDYILRASHLNVRPAMPANILRQGQLSALNVHAERTLGWRQLSALLVNRENIRTRWGLHHCLNPVCPA